MLDMDSAYQYKQNEVLHDYVDPFIKIFMCRRGGFSNLILRRPFWVFEPLAQLST